MYNANVKSYQKAFSQVWKKFSQNKKLITRTEISSSFILEAVFEVRISKRGNNFYNKMIAAGNTVLTGTVSRDNKQIKLHATYSHAYALWGPVSVPLSYFKLFRSFQCPHINQKKFKAVKVHKSLVVILKGRVCRRQPILHSWGCIQWNKKFSALTSIRFASFIPSSSTFFDFLGCILGLV